MKKFKFRLEKVLQYRHIVKDEKLRVLMECNHILNEAQSRLSELQHAALMNKLESESLFSSALVHLAGLYGKRLVEEIAMQKLEVMRAEEKVEEAMAEYIESAKEAETLDTLKERKKEEYAQYILKEEEKSIDEFNVQKGNHLADQ